MEQKLSKRTLLVLLKYLPWIIAVSYLTGCVFSCFGIYLPIIANTCTVSLLTFTFVLVCSFTLGFCVWHRLPLYYVLLVDLINLYDYMFYIPISIGWMLCLYSSLFVITVLLGAFLKNKYNVKKRNTQKNIN